MTTITISHKTSFLELLIIFCFIPALVIAKAIKAAYRAFIALKSWLNTMHDYSNDEGEIRLTGWQYLGFGLIVSIVAIILTIQF